MIHPYRYVTVNGCYKMPKVDSEELPELFASATFGCTASFDNSGRKYFSFVCVGPHQINHIAKTWN